LGFTFSGTNGAGGGRSRTYNTFDAHRLLHWAETQGEGRQKAFKEGLFKTYFTDGDSPASHEVLLKLVGEVGLDPVRAAEILTTGEYNDEVRERASFYQSQGIHSVPAIIINDKHLISGGQPVEVFEQALRQIAQQG
jgi:predicted DsbA family dithiol-disulfide isomerase